MRPHRVFFPASKRLHALAFACLMLPLAAQAAERCVAPPAEGQPVIGLALGGGGARGYAHVGVLKYLEEYRIPFHRIAGTSMGSIAGGLASTGLGADDIAQVVQEIDWDDMFSDSTDRQDIPMRRKSDDLVGLYGPKFGVGKDEELLPGGVVAGQKISFLFETLTAQRMNVTDFNDLGVPYRAVATDIVTGDLVVLDSGSLSTAMRASISVPGAFDPVRVGDKLLVDGGLVRNVPVDVVRDMGADVVIAVDVGTPLMSADEIGNALTIIEQMTGLAIVANTRVQLESLESRDVLISPALGRDITSASFDRFTDAFGLGYAAALEMADELSRYAVSEAEYAAWRESITRCEQGLPLIQFVRLDNRSRFSDEVIRELLNIETGAPLDTTQLEADLSQIYGLGFIRTASYRVVEDNGAEGVEITVLQDSRGTDFLETGLSIAGSGRGSFINLQLGYLKTDLDERGSELRVVGQVGDDFGALADVYKYLDDRQRWFLNPAFYGSRRDVLIFDQGQALANVRVSELGVGVRAGREIGRYAQVYLGLARSSGDAKVEVGIPQPELPFETGEFRAGLVWDRLDNLFLPTRGTRARLEYIRSDEQLGADSEFEQLLFSSYTSHSFGRNNLSLFMDYEVTLSGDTPVYALFTGGGFQNMSGFEPNELVGENFGVVGLGYRYQVVQSGLLPGYLGTTVEYGNAADDRDDLFSEGILNGSVYFAYDTPIGPVYLGYGWNDEQRGLLFLRLGAVLGSDSIGRR